MKIFPMIALAVSISSVVSLAVDETENFRQRYSLDGAEKESNERRVKQDMVECGIENANVAVYSVPALSSVKRLPDTYPDDGKLYAPLSWIASRDEFEPASFVFYPFKDFDKVEITVSDLKSKTGKIPASAIDLRVVKLWYQAGSAWYGYFADAFGRTLVPELLLHDENLIKVDDSTKDYYVRYENEDGVRRWAWMSARFDVTDYSFDNQANQGLIKDADTLQPFVLNKNEFKQILATIHIPSGQSDGIYKGELEVKARGAVIAKLTLRCRVLPLDLPEPMTSYNPEKGFYLCLYGAATDNEKIIKNLANHNAKNPLGFPSINPMNPRGSLDNIERAKKGGLNTRPLFSGVASCGIACYSDSIQVPEQAKLDNLQDKIEKSCAFAKKYLGHTDLYSYGADEGGPETIRAERPAWRVVHAAGAKVMVTSYAHRELLHGLDFLIIPSMPDEHRQQEVALFHESNPNALCGWYANPHCGPENPDYFRRVHGILAWKTGYDASANYCWWRNNWNDMAVPYEPNLRSLVAVYGTYDNVLDTLAWEGIREGLDDCRYATMLQQLCLKAIKSSDVDVLMKGRRALSYLTYWDAYRSDPNAFRAECINHILQLDAAMKGDK